MAPIKTTTTGTLLPLLRKTISTRSKNKDQNEHLNEHQQRAKRKADPSPLNSDRGVKRSALGNLTNALINASEQDTETGNVLKNKISNLNKQASQLIQQINNNINNTTNHKKTGNNVKIVSEIFTKPNVDEPKTRAATKILTRAASRQQLIASTKSSSTHPLNDEPMTSTIVKPKEYLLDVHQPKPKRRISNEFEKTEDSLYMSALEDITSSDSLRLSGNFSRSTSASSSPDTDVKHNVPKITVSGAKRQQSPCKHTPEGVTDFDFANWNDVFQVSHYANDIFNYLKNRECMFPIPDYMEKQPQISKWMRALLVDWMVEIQESFELNHETLYLAVKIVDLYLSKAEVQKEALQLLGATALFISSKYDERVPPTVDDFNYICDGAYKRREMILMEMNVFKTIGYDLGIPLSYRFLRRYARVNGIDMPVLTLARYILEYTLMDYSIIQLSDSKLASAALFIAMRMNKMQGWNETLEYYTGYRIEDFADIAILLNNIMTRKPKEALNTVRNKYSHELFFESSKKTFITDFSRLFETTGYDPSKSTIKQFTSTSV